MKKLRNTLYIAIIASSFVACTAKEDRESMGKPLPADQLEFTVTQTPGYDNEVTMESLTPEIIPYWDYGFGVSNARKFKAVIPFAGTFPIKYYAYGKGGPSVDSVEITVTENDANFFADPYWDLLTNGVDGKTWVWAVDNPLGCITGGGDYRDNGPTWWKDNMADQQAIINDKMTFDLNGSYNFELITPNGNKPGKFSFDVESMKLSFVGSDVSNGQNWNYDIIKLNENELVIAATHIESWGGFRNFYFFKKEGFVYP
ncbi:hypothetical protein COR50_09600 [Chitinophaga caeni]|uniref:PKD domain-containing protein n=1 Tax=Chitinophaga caeni TaxID=2029983 RepID=A0A291QU75_9BACT|nr:hypothetical protein [Chitinophaga caeni]ATL47404.1 hypothetical protein COR50_09600 [Chitinophaga caeni]